MNESLSKLIEQCETVNEILKRDILSAILSDQHADKPVQRMLDLFSGVIGAIESTSTPEPSEPECEIATGELVVATAQSNTDGTESENRLRSH